MRKPKSCFAYRRPPVPRGRIERFDEALEELRKYGERFSIWDDTCDSLASEEIERCVRQFLVWWDGEQLTPPPHFVRSQVQKIINATKEIVSLVDESHWAARVLVEERLREVPNTLTLSVVLQQTQNMLTALEHTAAGPCRIKDPDFIGAKLYLLECCLRIMGDAAGGVKPGLTKHNHVNQGGPLLRFTRAVFEYATGLRAADGAFDSEVRILRDLYPRRVPYAERSEGVNRLTHVREKSPCSSSRSHA